MNGKLCDHVAFDATITFPTFLSSLTRWVLRSKTKFAACVAKSFSISRSGTCPPTAVFPLLVPHIGCLARQRTPKLNAKRWRRLCLKRALHLVVMALNFFHGNLSFSWWHLLGRRPNPVQLGIYQRVRALLAACDPAGFLSRRAGQVLNSSPDCLSLSGSPSPSRDEP